MQGVAVDAQPGGGLDLDAVAGLEDLLDQLALDLADDPVVQVVGARAGGADALADQLGGQGGEVGRRRGGGSAGGRPRRGAAGAGARRSARGPSPRITARST